MYFFYHFFSLFRTQTPQRVSIIPSFKKDRVVQEVTCCQPLKFVPLAVSLWQDTFHQVLHKGGPPVLADEHSIALLPVCRKLAGPTLGLHLICVLTYVWQ